MRRIKHITLLLIIYLHNFGQITDDVFTTVETQAEFPGGINAMMNYLRDNVVYPTKARERGIGGKCFIRFVVSKSGKIRDVTLLKGVPNCSECDEEAVRVVKSMPDWNPAKMKGEPVNCYFNLPFSFKIDERRLNDDAVSKSDLQTELMTAVEKSNSPKTSGIVYSDLEQKPRFVGGIEALENFIKTNLIYPSSARESLVGGTVQLKFVVTDKGSLYNIEVTKSSGIPEIDDEAIRIIKSMPSWIPGKFNNENVNSYHTIPIDFSLNEPYFICNVNNINTLHMEGFLKAKQKKYDEALISFKRCLESFPEDMDALYNIAIIHYIKKETKFACDNFHKVIDKTKDKNLLILKSSIIQKEKHCN